MWSKNASLDGGTLSLAGIPAAQLAKEFGTPAFFLDEDAYRSRALAWQNGLQSEFGAHAGTIYYAAKSFICTAVAQWIADIGIGNRCLHRGRTRSSSCWWNRPTENRSSRKQ